MSDIGLFIDSEGFINIDYEDGDLKVDEGLQTAVLISLFTDARIDESEKEYEEQSVRGFWGDMFSEREGDVTGSKLWLFNRAKRTTETLVFYEDYAKKALAWLTQDGVAEKVYVSAVYRGGGLMLEIKVQKGKVEYKYSIFWDGQKVKLSEGF